MKTAFYYLSSLLLIVSASGCKRGVITYYTNGIVLANYDNCSDFIIAADGPVGDSCYVIRVNYQSDQTAFNGVNDNDTYEPGNLPTSVLIYSLQAFDGTHAAGSSLNEYFIAGPRAGATAEDIVTQFVDTKDFYPTHDPDDLWLMKPPATNGVYSFVVKMEFDNGITVRDTTTVNLN